MQDIPYQHVFMVISPHAMSRAPRRHATSPARSRRPGWPPRPPAAPGARGQAPAAAAAPSSSAIQAAGAPAGRASSRASRARATGRGEPPETGHIGTSAPGNQRPGGRGRSSSLQHAHHTGAARPLRTHVRQRGLTGADLRPPRPRIGGRGGPACHSCARQCCCACGRLKAVGNACGLPLPAMRQTSPHSTPRPSGVPRRKE